MRTGREAEFFPSTLLLSMEKSREGPALQVIVLVSESETPSASLPAARCTRPWVKYRSDHPSICIVLELSLEFRLHTMSSTSSRLDVVGHVRVGDGVNEIRSTTHFETASSTTAHLLGIVET